LFLRGEPSFLYLAFTTLNAAMSNYYRKGEPIDWDVFKKTSLEKAAVQEKAEASGEESVASNDEPTTDRLAGEWTEEETYRAQLSHERMKDDIPQDEFALYHSCVEETLEKPDEVWSMQLSPSDPKKLYHFIKYYPDEQPAMWYVIAAKETDEDDEQIEIVDAFPTRDKNLLDRYRHGEQEVGQNPEETRSSVRIVH